MVIHNDGWRAWYVIYHMIRLGTWWYMSPWIRSHYGSRNCRPTLPSNLWFWLNSKLNRENEYKGLHNMINFYIHVMWIYDDDPMTDEGHGTSYITWFDLEPDDICRHESEIIGSGCHNKIQWKMNTIWVCVVVIHNEWEVIMEPDTTGPTRHSNHWFWPHSKLNHDNEYKRLHSMTNTKIHFMCVFDDDPMTDEGHGTSYITWFDLEPDDICRHESEVIGSINHVFIP